MGPRAAGLGVKLRQTLEGRVGRGVGGRGCVKRVPQTVEDCATFPTGRDTEERTAHLISGSDCYAATVLTTSQYLYILLCLLESYGTSPGEEKKKKQNS